MRFVLNMRDDRNNTMWHGPINGPNGAAKAAPYDEGKVCREGEGALCGRTDRHVRLLFRGQFLKF